MNLLQQSLYINPDDPDEAILQSDCSCRCVGLHLTRDAESDWIYASTITAPYWEPTFWMRLRSCWELLSRRWDWPDSMSLEKQTYEKLAEWLRGNHATTDFQPPKDEFEKVAQDCLDRHREALSELAKH